jgi:hypothetical protein
VSTTNCVDPRGNRSDSGYRVDVAATPLAGATASTDAKGSLVDAFGSRIDSEGHQLDANGNRIDASTRECVTTSTASASVDHDVDGRTMVGDGDRRARSTSLAGRTGQW